jgi:signal peptidase I
VVAEAKPRSIVSIVLIGLFLGPVSVMLWLGRGKIAILYLVAQVAWAGLIFIPVVAGSIPPFAIAGISPSDTLSLLQIPLSFVGMGHALWIRLGSLARPWFSRWFVALPTPLLVLFLVAFVVRTLFYQPFNIPSGAMIPTLEVGDYIFVSKGAYGYGKYSFPFDIGIARSPSPARPERGDIVVFKLPVDNQTDYIKRIVGLPGERIQMIAGVLHIDGAALKKEAAGTYDNADGEAYGNVGNIPIYRETMPNGVSYMVLDAEPNGPGDNTPEYVVPDGHYFMMGDNRDNSLDSRYEQVAYVPYENLIGPAVLIFWNSRGVRINGRLSGHPTSE